MQKHRSNLLGLLKQLSSLLFVYALCRLLFFCFNYSYFSDLGFWRFLSIMIFGIRFDLSVVVLTNILFIVLFILPFPFREKKIFRFILQWLFLIVNSIALLANCIDFAYFQFTLKRTNATVFHFFEGGIGNDLERLLPLFLKEYWYLFFIWTGLIYLVYRSYKKNEQNYVPINWNLKQYGIQTLIFIGFTGLSIIAYRGGLQLKPISVVSAGEYAPVKYVPLVINTPFSILKTIDVEAIEPSTSWRITNDTELKKLYNPRHRTKNRRLRKLNVFIIALESFSKEYVGALNGRTTSYTPFLDSLIGQSLTFTNAFSNGKTSIEGIPSIVASIPTWMNEPYITSPYGSNQMDCLANKWYNGVRCFFQPGRI